MLNVRPNNPYTTGFVLLNYQRIYRVTLVYQPSAKDKYHVVKDGEELDGIAYKYFKDSKYWWILYDINRDMCPNPFELPGGTILIIPHLDSIISSQL